MIILVSSTPRERVAFAAVCESRGWPFFECDSVRKVARSLLQVRPQVVITRHKLSDGYSDDVIRLLRESSPEGCVKLIVLLSADSPAAVEARQVLLGADVVHRDPVRIDVIGAYIARFRSLRPSMVMEPAPAGRRALYFAGAMVDVMERTLRHGDRSVSITPREVELIQLLFESRGGVATYDILYNEILDRRFCGDTSNMRVLLGKLAGSFRRVGLSFRQHIEVVPKTGYRYSDPAAGLESG